MKSFPENQSRAYEIICRKSKGKRKKLKKRKANNKNQNLKS